MVAAGGRAREGADRLALARAGREEYGKSLRQCSSGRASAIGLALRHSRGVPARSTLTPSRAEFNGMASTSSSSPKLAVLIDADNAQPAVVEGLLAEIAKYGTATVKRIYGDWTGPQLKGWKESLLTYAIQPIQQFRYTTGKNATDSALIIDAMDLLYSAKLGGFCIVSSDSDFTRLAARVREAGLVVYGFGEKKTPMPFVSACDKFIYTEILLDREGTEDTHAPRSGAQLKQDTRLVTLLRKAVEAASDDSGWANLGSVGNTIAKQVPEFDSRNYGYRKLSELVAASGLFEIEKRKLGDGTTTSTWLRHRRGRSRRSEP